MGYELHRKVRTLNFPKAEKAVLGVLADFANDQDGTESFPSQPTIASQTGYSVKWVRKILRKLERLGVIVQTKKPGRRTSREYRIVLDAAPVRPEPSSGLNSPRAELSSGLNSNQDRNPVPLRPELSSPYPLLTPVEEYSLTGISRRKATRSTGDPRVKLLIESFGKKFQAQVGKPYVPAYGKDGKLLKRILALVSSPEEIEAAMDRYFADPFAKKTGFDIGRFVNAFNQVNSSESNRTRRDGDNEIIDFDRIRERAAARARDQGSTRVIPPRGKYDHLG